MNILVVNDDSIHAPGIALLARAAMALGDVWVVAPAEQCSAMSQKLTIRDPLKVEKVDFPVAVKGAYKVSGTPVDCVKVALHYILKEKPDYVFSGINDGFNAGFDIAYSGTLGAAFEAVMNGIPAIAFSNDAGESLDTAEKYLADIARELIREGQAPGEVWNVNFPGLPPEDVKGILRERTIAPVQCYSENYASQLQEDGSVILTSRGIRLNDGKHVPPDSDIAAVLGGYISVGKVKSVVL